MASATEARVVFGASRTRRRPHTKLRTSSWTPISMFLFLCISEEESEKKKRRKKNSLANGDAVVPILKDKGDRRQSIEVDMMTYS